MKKAYDDVSKRIYWAVKDDIDLKIFICLFPPNGLWLRIEPYEAVRDSMSEKME